MINQRTQANTAIKKYSRIWLLALAWLVLMALARVAAADTGTAPAGAGAGQPAATAGCLARVLAVHAARGSDDGRRPVDGDVDWTAVTLPDVWTKRWPRHEGTVWYRIDWERTGACPANAADTANGPAHAAHGATHGAADDGAIALGIDGMSMAGAVFVGDALLWRDAALVEPLSRSWNVSRWWVLPETGLHAGVNTLWVRVVGLPAQVPGLGALRLGSVAQVEAMYARNTWRQRTVYVFSAGLSAAVGCLFAAVWWMRRLDRQRGLALGSTRRAQEESFGWYALMSLAWTGYLLTILTTTPWPLPDSLTLLRLNVALFALYVLCFCLFTWRFGAQALPRTERVLRWAVAAGMLATALAPRAVADDVLAVVWVASVGVFFANCVQFQWHAWRPRAGGRAPQHMMLALCWLSFVVMGTHDLLVVLRNGPAYESWSAIAGLITTVCMALLLGSRLAAGMRRIERFNQELAAHVAEARAELALASAREHAQALHNAKLQERMHIAHDLHDGLGGSLVRGMALVEQSPEPLGNARMLSLLKTLRDDLRQVIDQGSGAATTAPATPVAWAAPLRHRFTLIFDALNMRSDWQIAPEWRSGQEQPSALQCLGLTRLVEEALSNVIKHSQARRVSVKCAQPLPGVFAICIEDDGVGFDVAAVQRAGLSVGMRSMAVRAERIGAELHLTSQPGRTRVSVLLRLPMDKAQGTPAGAGTAPRPAPAQPEQQAGQAQQTSDGDQGNLRHS